MRAPLSPTVSVLLLVLLVLLLAGCSGTGEPKAARATPATAPATSSAPTPAPGSSPSPRLDTWTVGASPLPLRPDGFGRVLRTPAELRDRRLPTTDLLPPPATGAFRGTVGPITPALRRRMGASWSPRCPVRLEDLRYLTVSFRGFDGGRHTGEIVVNASVARDVVGVFRTLYAADYPIEEMRVVTTADLDAPPTGDGNDTAGYVCRATRGQTTWSAHASGLAIDLNPFMNPYRRGDLVLPELASAYLDRSWRRPGMVRAGDVATTAFARIGWNWGGDFRTVSDRMHFTATGR